MNEDIPIGLMQGSANFSIKWQIVIILASEDYKVPVTILNSATVAAMDDTQIDVAAF